MSKLVLQGFPTDAAAIEYSKDINLFSEAHHILQAFFPEGVTDVVTFCHDPEGTEYPEVYEAWKEAGQEERMATIATCPSLGQWAVGLGGKKNAERAAKLAIALTIAAVSEPEKPSSVVYHHPSFGELCTTAGIEVPQGQSAAYGQ